MYMERSVRKYLDELSAKKGAPGGGSVAALTGALGAGLLSMVLRFSVDKPACARHNSWLKKALGRTELLRSRLTELADEDCRVFLSGEAAGALSVPLAVLSGCHDALRLCPDLVRKGNRALASDVGVAASVLEAAGRSAVYTVEINLRGITDRRKKAGIHTRCTRVLRDIRRICRTTEVGVGTVIRGKTDSAAHKRGGPAPDAFSVGLSGPGKRDGGTESTSARLFKIAKKMR